jgi:hypothetical protein
MMSAVPAMPASVNGSRIVDDVAFTLKPRKVAPLFHRPTDLYLVGPPSNERGATLSTSKIEGG